MENKMDFTDNLTALINFNKNYKELSKYHNSESKEHIHNNNVQVNSVANYDQFMAHFNKSMVFKNLQFFLFYVAILIRILLFIYLFFSLGRYYTRNFWLLN